MPYKFTFDISRVPRFFFTEIAKVSLKRGVPRRVGRTAQHIIKKFRIQEATGLNLSDAVVLLEDLIEMETRNMVEREKFKRARKRAIFLPHCSRKAMDSRCRAVFHPDIPSYKCAHCSADCLIHRATLIAENRGYDVYVVPGGSCISKILKAKPYEGVVGIACGEEIRLSGELLKEVGLAGQAIPLLKNGCSNTIFNVENLARILD